MNNVEVKSRFNDLREKYGEILIGLRRSKIPSEKWGNYIFKNLSDEEIAFIHGSNIWKFVNNKEGFIDLGDGTRVEIKQDSSKLVISPEKAAILTWICTDGYMSTHSGGHYISIKDDDSLVFDYFKQLVRGTYKGIEINFQISKIKGKNAFQCLFCLKKVFRDLLTYIPLSSTKKWTIPIELLNKESKKEVLKILTHTEGCTFHTVRRRAIEITLANPEVLVQA